MRESLIAAAVLLFGALPLGGCSIPQSSPAMPAAAATTDANVRDKDLLYVSDDYLGAIDILTYPGGKPVSTLGDLTAYGLCTDNAGDVFVAAAYGRKGRIIEFAHGGNTPIKVLKLVTTPEDCAVDGTTGDLAVTRSGDFVDVFKNARGKPERYRYGAASDAASLANCAYDDEGNLFVDLELSKACHRCKQLEIQVAELATGSSALRRIWSRSIAPSAWAGGLQWDGAYLAVGETSGIVYRIDRSGRTIGHFSLDDASKVSQFWLVGSTLVGANGGSSSVMFWSYPGGGAPTKTLRDFATPYGVTVSLANRSKLSP